MLAACGTPQQQCIGRAAPELRTLDRLIAETRTNLSRGYGYTPETRTRWSWQVCDSFRTASGHVRSRMCWEPVQETVQRPTAIDPEAESRKLEGLLARRESYVRASQAAIDDCRARFPE